MDHVKATATLFNFKPNLGMEMGWEFFSLSISSSFFQFHTYTFFTGNQVPFESAKSIKSC
jgi:hypothetical protein